MNKTIGLMLSSSVTNGIEEQVQALNLRLQIIDYTPHGNHIITMIKVVFLFIRFPVSASNVINRRNSDSSKRFHGHNDGSVNLKETNKRENASLRETFAPVLFSEYNTQWWGYYDVFLHPRLRSQERRGEPCSHGNAGTREISWYFSDTVTIYSALATCQR